jgi:hypothetical protein
MFQIILVAQLLGDKNTAAEWQEQTILRYLNSNGHYPRIHPR